MNFFFDSNKYRSVFPEKTNAKPQLANSWLATWRDSDGAVHHDLMPDAVTNNQGEYISLIYVLRHLIKRAEQNACQWLEFADIYGDSQLVIYQMNGLYQVKEAALKPLWLECLNYVHVLKLQYNITVQFHWIGRILNNRALGLDGSPVDYAGCLPLPSQKE